MFELDFVQTLAFAGVALLLGEGLRRLVPVLGRYNLPAPVLGGLLVAIVVLLARSQGVTLVAFDTTLQSPLMIAFFTTIGFGASLSLLKVGGPQVLRFFLLATVFAFVQNIVGILLALGFGLHPLFGVLAGSVTLTGGPATGLAFAPLFEQAGVAGASSVAIAVAIGGIVMGGLVGGPVSTVLVERGGLKTPRRGRGGSVEVALLETEVETTTVHASSDDDDAWPIIKNLVAILIAMWIGFWVSKGFAALGLTLPAYIGAMLVAAAIRNVDDATGWFGLSHGFINTFGIVSLTLFLVMALMTLKLWELAGLVLPLIAILAVQVVIAALAAAGPVFRIMGRNYESAVMSGGFIGFMLGTTANAMAVMRALVERYGPAPRAFLVAPIVGAFFIDFTNALIITLFLNLFS
ncbi:MAG TPA: sodium/glutamate symporter [Steroidobacteraceae bacterium]|nr:sodium/glutamate symporter [Steroidobacteraceae bacterium]